MTDLIFVLLGCAGILGAGCLCIVASVAFVALIDGAKKVMKKRKEDKHG